MSWVVWLAALLLAASWLLLAAHCCRLLLTRCRCRCGRARVSRDDYGRVPDCIFCCIIQHHTSQEQQQQKQQQLGTASPPPPPPSASRSHSPFDTIPDPSASVSPLSSFFGSPSPSAECQCARAHSPTPILFTTPWVVVFSPRRPAASRHLLVVPRTHIPDCRQLSRELSWRTQQEEEEEDSEKEAEEEEVGEQSKKDDEEFKQREEEEEEETDAAAAAATAPWTARRRRGGWPEEEKQLTASQYADHMLQVGRLLLAQPSVMADPQGGTRSSSSSSASSRSSLFHAASSWLRCQRRRRTGCRDAQHEPLTEAQSVAASESTRFCFHLPPFNSVSHLHLHCLQLPFLSCRRELSFTPGTPWCKDAQQLRAELTMSEQSVYEQQPEHRPHCD